MRHYVTLIANNRLSLLKVAPIEIHGPKVVVWAVR